MTLSAKQREIISVAAAKQLAHFLEAKLRNVDFISYLVEHFRVSGSAYRFFARQSAYVLSGLIDVSGSSNPSPWTRFASEAMSDLVSLVGRNVTDPSLKEALGELNSLPKEARGLEAQKIDPMILDQLLAELRQKPEVRDKIKSSFGERIEEGINYMTSGIRQLRQKVQSSTRS